MRIYLAGCGGMLGDAMHRVLGKEAIIDDVCGLLVPPRQEAAMAEAVARLLNNNDTAA